MLLSWVFASYPPHGPLHHGELGGRRLKSFRRYHALPVCSPEMAEMGKLCTNSPEKALVRLVEANGLGCLVLVSPTPGALAELCLLCLFPPISHQLSNAVIFWLPTMIPSHLNLVPK